MRVKCSFLLIEAYHQQVTNFLASLWKRQAGNLAIANIESDNWQCKTEINL